MPITRRRRANPPDQPENNNHAAEQTEGTAESLAAEQAPVTPIVGEQTEAPVAEHAETPPFPPGVPPSPPPGTPAGNGDRVERPEYGSPIEGGRRTARGELFRRPPQPPPLNQPPVGGPQSAPLQPPSHEITLPLGNLLHLAYNPSYTGADEARSTLLQRLADESKAGGRARCWNCGSLAIAYDRWNTRSKNFGEIGIALCEICGVWSVL